MTKLSKPIPPVKTKEAKPKTEKAMVLYKAPKPKKVVVPHAMVEAVCGVTDPFCVHANGSKYPDASSVCTTPFFRRQIYTMTTDANGYANLLFSNQYARAMFAEAQVYVGNTVTAWNPFYTTNTITGAAGYRIVSCGFIIRKIVSPLNASGMVHLRVFGATTNSSLSTVDLKTFNASQVANVPLQNSDEIAVVFPHSAQMPQTFYDVSGDTIVVADSTAKGYLPITVGVSGGPASVGVLSIETFAHYELIFSDDSDLTQLSTPSPRANTALVTAAAHVTSTMQPIVIEGLTSFSKYVGLRAAQALTTYFAGPTAGMMVRSAAAQLVD